LVSHAGNEFVPSVLIVDSSEETREVLETALAQRGVRTLSASRPAAGLALAEEHRPDVIVLDLEADSPSRALAERFAEQTQGRAASLVFLGSASRQLDCPSGEFVRKPYHYGPLISKIEALLAESRPLASVGNAA
jgi:DNA-binding response OmpR family regulator